MRTLTPSLTFAAALAAVPALAFAAAGHPDFTGAWIVTPYTGALKPLDGKPVPFTPAGKAAFDKTRAMEAKGDHSWDDTRICLPEGLPRIMLINEPFEMLQRDKTMFFVAQNRMPWKAHFGESLPTDQDTMYMGYSVAHWDGPALVVESGGFRDISVLDDKGLPHSEQLHLVQTFKLGAGGKTMTVDTTVTDPADYTRPWTSRATFARKPASFQMKEEVCAAKLTTTRPGQEAQK